MFHAYTYLPGKSLKQKRKNFKIPIASCYVHRWTLHRSTHSLWKQFHTTFQPLRTPSCTGNNILGRCSMHIFWHNHTERSGQIYVTQTDLFRMDILSDISHHSSHRPFRATAVKAAFAATPTCRESGSTRFIQCIAVNRHIRLLLITF
jgi:hypothetical protein